MACNDFPVNIEPQLTIQVAPDSAEADLSFWNIAVSSTGGASNSAAGERLIECCLFTSQSCHHNACSYWSELKSI